MKNYETYLVENNYAPTTIECYLRYRDYFVGWCESKGHELETIDYKDCLSYAKYIQTPIKGKTRSRKTAKHQIGALKVFFNYLIDENHRGDNPFQNMNIRGVKRTVNHNLLEYEELEDLFYSLQTRNIQLPNLPTVAVRDKVITGLMVYQGLNATSLKALKLEHINLEKGKIYIPSTRKTNARELEIKSQQILSFSKFIEESRPALQNEINCHTDALIPVGGERFPLLYALFKKLRRINLNVKDVRQVRASVITHWLKHHNIREVQYMAGHRYISSTERYQQDDLENLHEMIESLHPIT